MSLLFKETFEQYPVGHNLIGSGNMDWTARKGVEVQFNVVTGKWGYIQSVASWMSVSPNNSIISAMADGTIVFHREESLCDYIMLLFRYSASGGYYFITSSHIGYMAIFRFTGWDFQNLPVSVVNLTGSWIANSNEFEINLTGNNINLVIDNKQIWSGNDSTHSAGSIGFGGYYFWKMDDIYVFDNNSMLPVAPINLTLTILNANSIKLNFDNLAFNADYICIERKNGISGTFLEIDRAPGNAQSYIDRYCQPGNDYYYQVRAVRL